VASPGDVLNLTVTGLTSPALTVSGINSGAWSFGNAATVSYVSIESVNSTPALTSYDLILDMEPTLTSSDSSADMIDVRRNGTNLELRVDGTVVFNGDESGIRSLQVLGGNSTGGGNVPNDTLVITETASGLPQFAGTSAAPGSNVSGTFTSLTGYNNAGVPVKIHFDGRGGVNSLQYNLLTSHGVVYTPDNLDTAKSGNVGIASDGTFTTRQLGLSFENLSPLILTGAGGSLVIDASSAPSGDVTQLTVIGSGVDPVANLNAGSSTDGLAIVYPNPSSATFEPVLFSGFASTIIRSGAGADTIDLTSIDAADPDGAGPGEALTALSLDADSLTNSDNSGDTIIVRTLPATVTATLLGGQGNDAFNIYNDQGTGGTSDDSVDAILGQVVIASSANDEGGSDTVTVRDFADVTGDTVTITATTIDGIFDAGAGTDITLNNNVDNVSINTGSSNDTFNLNAGGVSNDIDSLTVSGNAGNDTFLIQSNSPAAAATQLNGNSGADLFQFSVGAFVLRGGIDGGSQNDLVDWSNYSTARTIALTGFGATDGYTLTDNSGASSVNGSPGSMTNIDAIRGSSGSDQLSQNFNVRTHWDLGGNVSGFGPFGVSSVNLANSLSDSGVLVADESDISLPLAVSPVGQPTGANPIVPSGGEQDLAWSGFENLTGAVNASDWFDWRNGASQSGTVDGRLGPDTFDYRDYSASVTVDLTTGSAFNVFGGAAGGIVADATGASIEHLMGGSAADQLTGDIDVNTIRGNDAADTINARDGVDDVDAGAGTDLIQVSGTEAEFDVMLGGPGGVEDPTDYDVLRNIGGGDVTLNGFNTLFNVFMNSIDEYQGNGAGVLGNGNANELHFGFATMTNTTGLNSGLGNDDVTTSHANVSEVAYDGDAGTDNVTLVLTPNQFGALTTADIFIVQDYVVNPTGKSLTLTADDTKGNFTAVNFETARIAVYDDDIIVDITTCFLAIQSEDQIIEGTMGDDMLTGTNLTDLIFGQDGNDVIYGGNASDCIFGGAHNDQIYGENLDDLLVGGSGSDILFGGDDEDTIFGNSGADLLFGEAGHDTLDGGSGNDQLDGGTGSDTLNGGVGVDTVLGGTYADRILIRGDEAETDTIDGGADYDTLEIIAGSGTATLQGFSLANTVVETVSSIEAIAGNNQTLQGNGAANLFDLTGIAGPTGLASINGLGGDDTITGSASSDVINGGDGNDLLSGGVGFDVINGGNDNDTISGGLHDDTINGGAGVDTINGDDGFDVIQVSGAESEFDTMNGGNNTDVIVAIGGSPITLNGFNSLTNSIEGWAGNGFSIQGNGNANVLNFQLVGSMTGVPFIDGGLGNDTITGTNGVDNLRGGVGDDVLFGLGGVDTLLGGADNDSLNGGDGIDHLYGEAGVDTITTGAGRDIVYFASDETLTDTITDFALYSDTINLAAYVPVLTYSSLTFSIGVGYREVILPNGKRIRLNGWNRNPTSSQFQF
jgi:Ca2+-binding RTX toxin-like protein